MLARGLSQSISSFCLLSSLLSATCASPSSAWYSSATATMSSSSVTPKLSVYEVPCWKDNYAYLLVNEATKDCAAVDPVEADKVKALADELGLKIRAVLTTHHHGDHAGGNENMRQLLEKEHPGLPIYGGDDRILALTHQVGQGDVIHLGSDEQKLDIQVLSTPCHTRGHVLYFAQGAEDSPVLFTGDTLFVAGCGRFFEGDGDQMHNALNKIIAGLPLSTRIFCGHEYTVANLNFAVKMEPGNVAIRNKLAWAENQRSAGQPTIPSTIEEELATNPFMRLDSEELLSTLGLTADMPHGERMSRVREAKNAS